MPEVVVTTLVTYTLPYTLHPTSYTLRPAPHTSTLNRTPYQWFRRTCGFDVGDVVDHDDLRFDNHYDRLHLLRAGAYLRLIYSCITQLKAQRPSRTCNESKEEDGLGFDDHDDRLDLLQPQQPQS